MIHVKQPKRKYRVRRFAGFWEVSRRDPFSRSWITYGYARSWGEAMDKANYLARMK